MKLYMVSLGCHKNLVDAETIIKDFEKSGHELTNDESNADAVIIMTCAFIGPAKEEARSVISEFTAKKKRYGFKVFVGGCYAKRYSESVASEFPAVDGWFGIGGFEGIAERLEKAENGSMISTAIIPSAYETYSGRRLTTPPHRAWLKISDGCSHKCAYCAIPMIRGNNYRSRTIEDILKEANELAEKGVREFGIIAQDTGLYGIDLEKRHMLVTLLEELEKIKGPEWIRLLYINPFSMPKDLLSYMKSSAKTVPYLDIPMQHASQSVLRRMKRPGCGSEYLDLIAKIREELPDAAIRSTFIVGFPGETDEEFEELEDFIEKAKINRAGFFEYSDEEGTAAYGYDGKVSEIVKRRRSARIMRLQQKISADITSRLKGKTIEVMAESPFARNKMRDFVMQFGNRSLGTGNAWLGRTKWDAPEVDALALIELPEGYIPSPGEIMHMEVTHTGLYDIAGKKK